MILLPPHLYKQYRSFCSNSGISDNDLNHYLKWLRYFLDFCEKYKVTGDDAERLQLYLSKLQQKGQSETKRQQAEQAVSCYFTMIRGGTNGSSSAQPVPTTVFSCLQITGQSKKAATPRQSSLVEAVPTVPEEQAA